MAATTLPGEVIEPAARRVAELRERGELDAERERAAAGIAHRVLATLRRYVQGRHEEPQALAQIDRARERVEGLLERAAPEGEPGEQAAGDAQAADAQAVG